MGGGWGVSVGVGRGKKEKGISGAEAAQLLQGYGVLEYLKEHFEVLHTQSKQWLLADIDEFIKLRKEAEL